MSTENVYRLLRGYHSRWEGGKSVMYAPGDLITMTEDEAANFHKDVLGSKLELISVAEQEIETIEDKTGTDAEGVSPAVVSDPSTWAFISDQTVVDVISTIRALDTIEDVTALMSVESSNRNRKGVIVAAQNRIDELSALTE